MLLLPAEGRYRFAPSSVRGSSASSFPFSRQEAKSDGYTYWAGKKKTVRIRGFLLCVCSAEKFNSLLPLRKRAKDTILPVASAFTLSHIDQEKKRTTIWTKMDTYTLSVLTPGVLKRWRGTGCSDVNGISNTHARLFTTIGSCRKSEEAAEREEGELHDSDIEEVPEGV